ncbi:Galactokinase [Pseudodesulfovibrio mercurii]|uniref:Galactokinase n=1 Tax=Pseudodesulfovibrio mercurii TaxID=641491 RepID=F0JJP1_9BACT|nr:galactokinase family protein [Pseudodesulfovibrio mercurii]EGB16140.1 Galactokinase [Pseudodesulfovibrio mercurii]
MTSAAAYAEALRRGDLDAVLAELYRPGDVAAQRARYLDLLARFVDWPGPGPAALVLSPGRTELGGNHTDHNLGVVLAAAVQFDCLAAARPNGGDVVRIRSKGFDGEIVVDLNDLAPRPEEEDTSAALVRGVAAGLAGNGRRVAGFDARVDGEVPLGAGLSSSAAFEVLVGRIFSELFNGGACTALELAVAGRAAENVYFGKPCGLMDQLSCAAQGILSIDFADPAAPAVREVDFDFERTGYRLAVVATGGSHADLTPDYAAIPDEMGRAARALGREHARGLTVDAVLAHAARVREAAGDRGVLRLIHFIEETDRAAEQAEVLAAGRMDDFLDLVRRSGDSSWRLLQNCISATAPLEQPIPLALTLTERFLGGRGACRIQGGGFAGTIQAYVPEGLFAAYAAFMEGIFGPGAVMPLKVRRPGFERISLDGIGGEARA